MLKAAEGPSSFQPVIEQPLPIGTLGFPAAVILIILAAPRPI